MDRSSINWNKQHYGICVPFSYCKAVSAIHSVKDQYLALLVSYIHTFEPRLINVVSVNTNEIELHKIVDCIGWDLRRNRNNPVPTGFDINYTFLHTEVSKLIHKSLAIVTDLNPYTIDSIIKNPQESDIATKPNSLINLAFHHQLPNGTEWHSVIVGFDKDGLYICDPNHDTPYKFAEVYTNYKVITLGEVLYIAKPSNNS